MKAAACARVCVVVFFLIKLVSLLNPTCLQSLALSTRILACVTIVLENPCLDKQKGKRLFLDELPGKLKTYQCDPKQHIRALSENGSATLKLFEYLFWARFKPVCACAGSRM